MSVLLCTGYVGSIMYNVCQFYYVQGMSVLLCTGYVDSIMYNVCQFYYVQSMSFYYNYTGYVNSIMYNVCQLYYVQCMLVLWHIHTYIMNDMSVTLEHVLFKACVLEYYSYIVICSIQEVHNTKKCNDYSVIGYVIIFMAQIHWMARSLYN